MCWPRPWPLGCPSWRAVWEASPRFWPPVAGGSSNPAITSLLPALGEALGDPTELSQRGRVGKDHVAPSLDMANIAQRYRQIYAEVSG